MQMRLLDADEVDLIWTIDRSETHDEIYVMRDGALAIVPNHFEIPGWPPGQREHDTPRLRAADARIGAFDGEALAGVAVVEAERLFYLFVDRRYRGRGVGSALFEEAARHLPGRRMVVSATPTRNTVDFYLGRGCVLDPSPDPAQFAAEPDDIHLVWVEAVAR
jgi:GNAT superfamily N-acetyltransferase